MYISSIFEISLHLLGYIMHLFSISFLSSLNKCWEIWGALSKLLLRWQLVPILTDGAENVELKWMHMLKRQKAIEVERA